MPANHIFVGSFCIFCGGEDESSPCTEPSTFAETVLYETKYWMAEHGWNGVDATRWHEITTHVAGCIFRALSAVKKGADQVTFNYSGQAKTHYVPSFMAPGLISGILKEGHRKIEIEILPNRSIRTAMLIATMLRQEKMEMRSALPVAQTAEAIANHLRRQHRASVS